VSADAGQPAALDPGTDTAVLEQGFDGDSLYALRSAVAAHAADAGLPRGRIYDVVTAVHELAANAVRHGAGHGRLRLWADGKALYCQVSDDGPADQDPAAADVAWPREPGHGLWIIDQIADRVTLERTASGTTVVTVSFAVGVGSPPGPPGG
jgi:anti-sigma regulatory factor (Ser/Thr protein kinase)